MKFQSNRCIAIHLPNLAKAERFYSDVLGFKLKSKSRAYLEYDTGHFLLYINKSAKARPPIPSFDVKSVPEAKAHLKAHGCKILIDRGGSLYFCDPFGITYDVIED
jgi:catechol 2,3-dioxygenase-like lactoylglutathione lyase family enzyme